MPDLLAFDKRHQRDKTASSMRSIELLLIQGLIRSQRCKLHRGRRYRHRTTGRIVTYLGPWMHRSKKTWAGSVRVKFVGEDSPRPVKLSSLEEVARAA